MMVELVLFFVVLQLQYRSVHYNINIGVGQCQSQGDLKSLTLKQIARMGVIINKCTYLTKVSAHSWAVWVVTCKKLWSWRFSLSSALISKASPIDAATSVMFHGLTRIAPAPRDCAAPANYRYTSSRVIYKYNKLYIINVCMYILHVCVGISHNS